MDLALNELQGLMCHGTQQTKTNHLLSILAALNYTIVWMVSIRSPIYNYSNPFLCFPGVGSIPSIATDIFTNLSAPQLSNFSVWSDCLSLFSLSLIFTVVRWDSLNPPNSKNFFFFNYPQMLHFVWDLYVSQNAKELYASHSLGRILV